MILLKSFYILNERARTCKSRFTNQVERTLQAYFLDKEKWSSTRNIIHTTDTSLTPRTLPVCHVTEKNKVTNAFLGGDCCQARISGSDPAAGSPTATLLRLLPPCRARIRHHPIRRSRKDSGSSRPNSGGATGGVCKEQGRIHRLVMTGDY